MTKIIVHVTGWDVNTNGLLLDQAVMLVDLVRIQDMVSLA